MKSNSFQSYHSCSSSQFPCWCQPTMRRPLSRPPC